MKDLMGWLAKALFYALAVILVGWTASLTLAFVSRALPNMWLAPYLSLAVFDAGMIIWMFVFLHHAKGVPQRAIALGASLIDLIGVGMIVVAEIMTGGQQFAEIPADLGAIAIWGLSVWTFINVAAVISFHLTDPEALQEMAVRSANDRVIAESLALLTKEMGDVSGQVASRLSARMVRNSVQTLIGQAGMADDLPSLPAPRQPSQVTVESPAMDATSAGGPQLLVPARAQRCLYVKGDGTQCKRYARRGRKYCPQHSNRQ